MNVTILEVSGSPILSIEVQHPGPKRRLMRVEMPLEGHEAVLTSAIGCLNANIARWPVEPVEVGGD